MSDNLPRDLPIIPYLDIPTEVFTESFTFLTRRELIKHIEPVNKTFKKISDRNVNVHVIERIKQFFRNLKRGDPEANQQVEDLARNNCALAGQFVIDTTNEHPHIYTNDRASQAIQAVLRNSVDLFQKCQISTDCQEFFSTELLNFLSIFEPAKPAFVQVNTYSSNDASLSTLLRHPTLLNCSSLKLSPWVRAQDDYCQPIFDWLHHKPTDLAGSSSTDVVDQQQQQQQPGIRHMFVSTMMCRRRRNGRIRNDPVVGYPLDLKRCVQNLEKGRVPSDRRNFLFTFMCHTDLSELLNEFPRTENPSTGEVLLFERVVNQYGQHFYRLLRCLATQIANGTEELYAQFESTDDPPNLFNIGDEQSKKPLCVNIENRPYCETSSKFNWR